MGRLRKEGTVLLGVAVLGLLSGCATPAGGTGPAVGRPADVPTWPEERLDDDRAAMLRLRDALRACEASLEKTPWTPLHPRGSGLREMWTYGEEDARRWGIEDLPGPRLGEEPFRIVRPAYQWATWGSPGLGCLVYSTAIVLIEQTVRPDGTGETRLVRVLEVGDRANRIVFGEE